MASDASVLVVGATGNVGTEVVEQLLARGVSVKALVRSVSKLPSLVKSHANFSASVIKGILETSEAELVQQLVGCDAVVVTIGHTPTLWGIWGPPWFLVTECVKKLCRAVEASEPSQPIRIILLNSAGVRNPAGIDRKRDLFEGILVFFLMCLIPPLRDSYFSASYLGKDVGTSNKHLEWCVIRPGWFVDGERCAYDTHEQLQHSLFHPEQVRKANIAHFICELASNNEFWGHWKNKMPVIMDSA